jgi:PilZ domain
MASAPQPKSAARVALIGLSQATADVFTSTFQRFSVETAVVKNGATDTVSRERFRACVLQLGPKSDALVQRLRGAAGNMTILGVCANRAEMGRYARLGLTALLPEPVDQATVERIVKGTQLLIAGELRKHVRIPIVLEAEFRPDGEQSFTGFTRELSYGGLSLATSVDISPDHDGELTLRLPSGQKIKARATLIWRHHPDLLGFKFSADDPQREVVRKWIEQYLELAD